MSFFIYYLYPFNCSQCEHQIYLPKYGCICRFSLTLSFFLIWCLFWTLSYNYSTGSEFFTIQIQFRAIWSIFDAKIKEIILAKREKFAISNIPIIPTSSWHSTDFNLKIFYVSKILSNYFVRTRSCKEQEWILFSLFWGASVSIV